MLEGIRRKFHMIARIEADSRRDLANHLHSIAESIDREEMNAGPSVSGGYSSGHVIFLHVNDSMTHSGYFELINAELEKIDNERKARST